MNLRAILMAITEIHPIKEALVIFSLSVFFLQNHNTKLLRIEVDTCPNQKISHNIIPLMIQVFKIAMCISFVQKEELMIIFSLGS